MIITRFVYIITAIIRSSVWDVTMMRIINIFSNTQLDLLIQVEITVMGEIKKLYNLAKLTEYLLLSPGTTKDEPTTASEQAGNCEIFERNDGG